MRHLRGFQLQKKKRDLAHAVLANLDDNIRLEDKDIILLFTHGRQAEKMAVPAIEEPGHHEPILVDDAAPMDVDSDPLC